MASRQNSVNQLSVCCGRYITCTEDGECVPRERARKERFLAHAAQPPAFTGQHGIAGETRITDPATGGQKGQKLARFSLIPSDWLWSLAEHYGVGARKYEDRNWERGYKWSLSVDAHSRHLHAWLDGESYDQETGSHHLIAAAWHLIALWWFQTHERGTDDVRVNS